MRFSSLDLIKYGRFDGCQLTFPAEKQDLHIVFGPNEAGKSTTMAAIGDLLFGFPHVTPYDFRFDRQLLRVGATLEDDGSLLCCRRKKGRASTLLDSDDQPLDEGRLAAMLAGYSADAYQRMFSLDHYRLRAGGEAILSAEDDVGQAIFAAGSGMVGVTALLKRIEDESKQIWTKRAGERLYYSALRLHDEARKKQREAQLRPAAWDELRREIERGDNELAALRARRTELGGQREVAQRRRRVIPHAAHYGQLATELETLGQGPDLPDTAAVTFTTAKAAIASAAAELLLAQNERDRLQQALEGLTIDHALLQKGHALAPLREEKGVVDKHRADLPRRKAELGARTARIAEHLGELGWPAEPTEAVKARLPRKAAVVLLRSLLEERTGLDVAAVAAVADHEAAAALLERLQNDAGSPAAPRDIEELSAALATANGLGDIERALRLAGSEVTRREELASATLAQLSPWSGTGDALAALLLPSAEQAAAAIAEATGAQLAIAELRRTRASEGDRQPMLELQRTHLQRDDMAVAPQQVEEARGERDLLWHQVRDHVEARSLLEDPSDAADRFEHHTTRVDELTDHRFAAAEQSSRLTDIQEELESTSLKLEQLDRELELAESAITRVEASWLTLLEPAGLSLDPQEFAGWVARRAAALAALDELGRAQAEHADLAADRDRARVRLAAALAVAGNPAPAEAMLATLITSGGAIVDAEADAARVQAARSNDIAKAEQALALATRKTKTAEAGIEGWQQRWKDAVTAAGLSAACPAAMVRSQIETIEELRSLTDEALTLEHRNAAMEADIAGFEERVHALAAEFAHDIGADSPAAVLETLVQQWERASGEEEKRALLAGQLAAAEERIGSAEAAHARARALLAPLLEAADIGDDTALSGAIERSDRVRWLKIERDRVASEILQAGAGPPLGVLLDEIKDVDAASLVSQCEELDDDLEALADEITNASAVRATTVAEFARLDDGADAAEAAADAELALSEMAAQAETYIRKRTEAALLRWTIARYRSEKQAPLLRRASELFCKLTLERYCELLVDFDEEKARLAGKTTDEEVIPVSAMSDGTVDQLFLALRVAAVEEAVRAGAKLPFLADDLFINYDNERAAVGFQVMAELAKSTQVLFFTHHHHLVDVASSSLAPANISQCVLN